jgi:hypothetical protein
MIMKKQTTKGGVASEYRNIAVEAVKLLKSIPFRDIKLRNEIDSLFDRLADNDIALQEMIRKEAVENMGKAAEEGKADNP